MSAIASSIKSTAQSTYDLFVFGDSLSDTGNIFQRTVGLFPPSPPYFNGRFSNGPLAVETLAHSLGLNLSQTTNFAVGGARSGRTNIFENPLLPLGGLLTQIDRFSSQASAIGAGAEDLYVIWAGANDFLSQPSDLIATLNEVITNIATAVTTLAQRGARNIVVAQNPNFGRTPLAIERGLQQPLTQISTQLNAALASTLTLLEGSLGGANVILTDLFPIAESVVQNPAAFGFSNVTTPYLEGFSPADPAANPSQFFFWDDVHPTTRGHDLFAGVFRRTLISEITENVVRIGTSAADRLVGFAGDDLLRGLEGADALEGNAGGDALLGGAAADQLVGGGGDDRLTGGEGQDVMRGGIGRDRYIYTNVNELGDTILGFQANRDGIDLRQAFNQLNYQRGNRDRFVRTAQVGSDTAIRVDINGNTAGGFRTLTVLSDVVATTLSDSNFLLG